VSLAGSRECMSGPNWPLRASVMSHGTEAKQILMRSRRS
jgi:hypothetical protein